MNVSEIFIRRPVATLLMMAGIAMFGILAYMALPVSDLPAVDFPTLSVSASLPGADRVRVEVRIAAVPEVAAPREVRQGLGEKRPPSKAFRGHRGAARHQGLDPHGARRALVAARFTRHVRACAGP